MGFGDDVAAWCEESPKQADMVLRKVAIDLFSSVIFRTPVDNGFHRGAWECTQGTPGKGNPGVPDRGGSSTVNSAAAVVQSGPMDSEYWLANSAPAINVLEYGGYPTRGGQGPSNGPRTVGGYSRQAPRGMVRVAIQEFEGFFNARAREGGFND